LSKKKKILLVIGGVFAFLIILALASPSGREGLKEGASVNTETQKGTEQETNGLAEYRTAVLSVIAKMESANQAITRTGELGSQMEFESAQVYLDEAEKTFLEAKKSTEELAPPEGAEEVHRLLNQALDKYLEAVSLYQEGLGNLDADKINEGVAVYSEATEIVGKVAEEAKKLPDE